ncbi:MAG: AraC family transcriptional regulator [Polyangiaceae bacterium]|nr:AraC family transcriptional regulator [Polyangiaceae bacterium]
MGSLVRLEGTQMLAQWTWQLVREAGLPAPKQAALLAELGLDASALSSPDATIAHDAACELWARLCEGRPDDYGARFPERVEPRSLGLVGYLAVASPSLGEMFARVVRFHHLVKRPATATLVREKRTFSVVEALPPTVRPWPPPLAESVLSAWLLIGRRLTGASFDAAAVRFQHGPPRVPARIARVFGCDVTWHAPVNELVLPSSIWDLPLVTSDPTLLRYLETLAGNHQPQDEVERLRTEIARSLSGTGSPSLAATARALAVSARTLQRRLDAQGMSYRDVVDDVRRETAERLIDEGGLSLVEISYLVGFNDPSALRKARKRWKQRTAQARTCA